MGRRQGGAFRSPTSGPAASLLSGRALGQRLCGLRAPGAHTSHPRPAPSSLSCQPVAVSQMSAQAGPAGGGPRPGMVTHLLGAPLPALPAERAGCLQTASLLPGGGRHQDRPPATDPAGSCGHSLRHRPEPKCGSTTDERSPVLSFAPLLELHHGLAVRGFVHGPGPLAAPGGPGQGVGGHVSKERHSRDLHLSPPALPWALTQPPPDGGPGPQAAAMFMSAVRTGLAFAPLGPTIGASLTKTPVQAEATKAESGFRPLPLKTPARSPQPLPGPGLAVHRLRDLNSPPLGGWPRAGPSDAPGRSFRTALC